jgi:hypothetical protein
VLKHPLHLPWVVPRRALLAMTAGCGDCGMAFFLVIDVPGDFAASKFAAAVRRIAQIASNRMSGFRLVDV